MNVTPESVLTWWDVVDKIGLIGVLLGAGAGLFTLVWRYLPDYKKRIVVDERMNEFLADNQVTLGDIKATVVDLKHTIERCKKANGIE
jgi:hypothetical protein